METITGTVFDIKQLAVFDGPGIRTTVFLKGCPLRCAWCHNPEGLSPSRQLMVSTGSCIRCGECKKICEHPENCVTCGACILSCPLHIRKICGVTYTDKALAEKLLRDKDILEKNGGGITFSGGEPTMQAAFLLAVLKRLKGMHRAIETCGYCRPDIFQAILGELELVIMDIKLADPREHKKWTGKNNAVILHNLEILKNSRIPFHIRIPVIPGVNDSEKNFEETAGLLRGASAPEKVELLPYHRIAGAKYTMVGMAYRSGFEEERAPYLHTDIFEKYGISAKIL